MTLRPAARITGIVFRRTDLPDPVESRRTPRTSATPCLAPRSARASRASPPSSTCCRRSPAWASTTRSSTSRAAEVPIMDGSAGPFVFLLQSAGIEEQAAPKRFVRVQQARARRGGRQVGAVRALRRLQGQLRDRVQPPDLQAPRAARVDGFLHDLVPARKSAARAPSASCATSRCCARATSRLGGILDNAIVLDDFRVLNEDGLRYEDEFVKHKILDAIGDLYLLGHSLIGEFNGHKSGHALNNLLLRTLLADKLGLGRGRVRAPRGRAHLLHRSPGAHPSAAESRRPGTYTASALPGSGARQHAHAHAGRFSAGAPGSGLRARRRRSAGARTRRRTRRNHKFPSCSLMPEILRASSAVQVMPAATAPELLPAGLRGDPREGEGGARRAGSLQNGPGARALT